MSLLKTGALPGRIELVKCELTDRFEHRKAGRAVRIIDFSHQTLVDQRREAGQKVELDDACGGHDQFNRVHRRAAREVAQTAKEGLLIG
jgi:hypothetical protein